MSPEELKANVQVGIIGAGDMGHLYATKFRDAGWKVNICDLPTRFVELKVKYPDDEGIQLLKDGFAVSRCSDYIIYSVEAEKSWSSGCPIWTCHQDGSDSGGSDFRQSP
ncbi:prephenate dehydrogenase (NADP(+)) [Entomophthora muscae]|uniref:Prephenate dehydrogenase (NADP(+)) n=1 Tax=Entomophthora muscae TaxID=34485 RepID=A0ACC2UNZ6_9FUNG|nr:prephenate dehydrogenase (NADP(+)) [Entomophthora muscae]